MYLMRDIILSLNIELTILIDYLRVRKVIFLIAGTRITSSTSDHPRAERLHSTRRGKSRIISYSNILLYTTGINWNAEFAS